MSGRIGIFFGNVLRRCEPFARYVVKNRLIFAALLYSVALQAVELYALYASSLNRSFGNPFVQGLWSVLALFGLCLLAGKRAAKILLTVLLSLQSLECCCSVFLSSVFALRLTSDAFVIFISSSPSEVREFVSVFTSWRFLACISVGAAAFAAALFVVWKPTLERTRHLYLICAILILPQVVNAVRLGFGDEHERRKIYERNPLAELAVNTGRFYRSMDKMSQLEKHPELPPGVEYTAKGENMLAVVVIGESATRFHHSIYGYPRLTSPALGARKELCVFTDVVSGYAHTVRACGYMFTAADVDHPEDYRCTLFDVFRAAGFRSYHCSNQSRWGKYDSPINVLTAHADGRFFLQEHFPGSFDDRLVEEFRRGHDRMDGPTLVVFHLIGSHYAYKWRTPEDRKVFTAADRPVSPYKVDKWRKVDEYDDSIRFTDYVLGRILDMVDSKPYPAFFLYCSDHGDFPEQYSSQPRSSASTAPEYYEVPFVFYANAAYRDKFPETMKAIRGNLDKPYLTDDLLFAVFSAARITFDGFPRGRDLFSADFVPRTDRRVGERLLRYRSRKNPFAVPPAR